ncbi:MAG: co-chaperone GroES [Planctomycetota bacterium]|jgi:chaperonin GroES
MSKFKPLGDRVLVEPIEEDEQKSTGGIIIPDSAKEKPIKGKVAAVGPGGRRDDGERIPMELKKGDRVLYGKYSGTEVKINGVEQLIMRESDVYGIIED